MRASLALAAVALGCSACATRQAPPPRAHVPVATEAAPAWMQTVRADTAQDIDALPRHFAAARTAIVHRATTALSREGALLDPDAAQTAPDLPPGPYHCRLLRLGRAGVRSFAPDLCHVIAADGGMAFSKGEGANIIDGYLYADGPRRLVMLGALRRGGTPGKGRYGDDPDQDVAGVVERVSAFRWRLVLTRAGGGAAIDLYELVPVTPVVPGAKPLVPSD